MTLFKPTIYNKDIFSINYDKLKEKGITCLVFDLDNTLGLENKKIIKRFKKRFFNINMFQ